MCDFVCVPAICRTLIYNNQAVHSPTSILASFARTVLLILSFIVYNAGEHAKGYLDGLRESERIILELLKKKTE